MRLRVVLSVINLLGLAVFLMPTTRSFAVETQLAAVSPLQVNQSFEETLVTPEESRTINLYKAVNQAVVHITGFGKGGGQESGYLKAVPERGNGSGSVIDPTGLILTNYHVVQNTTRVQVTFFDGTKLPAKVLGTDPDNDLAVIKVDPPSYLKLTAIKLGDSAGLQVGRKVLAIGNPFGLDRTLTEGIVSGVDRSLKADSGRVVKGIIQTDAAINPGNSGGPLIDLAGRIVGINTAIVSRTGQNSGIGFAVPINIAKKALPKLIAGQHIVRPEIGIFLASQTNAGLRILKLAPNGPAQRAGLAGPREVVVNDRGRMVRRIDQSTADIITSIDKKPVNTVDELLSSLEDKQPGDVIEVGVLRSGRTISVPVRLSTSQNIQT